MDRHDPGALSIMLQVIKDIQPDEHIDLGDLWHGSYLSHWQVGRDMQGRSVDDIGETMLMNIQEDNNLINRWYDLLQRAMPKKAEFWQLEGNHEEILRVSRNMNRYQGYVTNDWYPQKSWRLEERGVKWVDYQRYGEKKNWVDIGKHLKVLHGHYVGTNHLAKHFQHWQCNLRYGHIHTIEEKSFPSLGAHKSVKSLGCLCTPTASYHRGRIAAWGQGFGVIYLHPGGTMVHSTTSM